MEGVDSQAAATRASSAAAESASGDSNEIVAVAGNSHGYQEAAGDSDAPAADCDDGNS